MTDETTTHAQVTARDILRVIPLVMRTVAAELRAAGELPAPAHFGLLSLLAAHPTPQTLTELAGRQGVSLPTMSNSISALVARGWVRHLERGAQVELGVPVLDQWLRRARAELLLLADALQPARGDVFAVLEQWGFDDEAATVWLALREIGRAHV